MLSSRRARVSIGAVMFALAACGSSGSSGGGNKDGGGGGSGGSATGAGGGSGGATATGGATGAGGGSGGATATGGATGAGGGSGGAGATDGGATTQASFFITSTGSGTAGGNLGGLDGADGKCQTLATAAGLGGKTWHAYLSTNTPAVNARDRIGSGPWFNVRGAMIAADLTQLHEEGGMTNGITPTTALDETGATIPTNQHDILTGSGADGRTLPATPDRTCAGWTSSSTGTAQVGHENRTGTGGNPPTSWNSAHATPDCSQAMIAQVGGAGRLYCFAVN